MNRSEGGGSFRWLAGHWVLLLGCASAVNHPARAENVPAGAATPLELTVVGGPELNPSGPGRPSPVVVRIFELTESPAFQGVDYATVFEHPTEALKAASISQEEFVLRPGDVHESTFTVEPRVRVLGVAAAFRDMEHGVWHLTVAIIPGQRNFILIDLDRDTIRQENVDAGRT